MSAITVDKSPVDSLLYYAVGDDTPTPEVGDLSPVEADSSPPVAYPPSPEHYPCPFLDDDWTVDIVEKVPVVAPYPQLLYLDDDDDDRSQSEDREEGSAIESDHDAPHVEDASTATIEETTTPRRTISPDFDRSVLAWAPYARHVYNDDLEHLSTSEREDISISLTHLMKPLKEPGGREVLTLADEEIISRYNANSQMDHIPTDTIRAIIILWLKIILGSLDAQECILELRDDEARVFLTAFQEFLDWMRDETKALSLLPEASLQDIRDLRRRAMRLLVNLTKSSKDFPPSLFFTVQGKLPRDISIPGNNANLYIVSHKVGDQVTTLVAKQLRTFLNCQADAAKVREEFYREAITWRQVDHPRLLPFLGIWQYPSYPEDIPFLVAPYMEKGSSKGYVANKDVTREIVNRLLVDTLEGLVYLHSLGIVHCDIAGKNVLVDDSSGEIRALLCDFGISGVYSNPHSTMYNPPSELAGGTLRWMAPETQDAKLHARQQPSFKSDSYSFGSLALELYSGMIPFEVEFPSVRDEARISLEVVKGLRPAHPGAGMYGREMPPWLWSLIGECWKDDPAERPDATTLLERLRKETLLK